MKRKQILTLCILALTFSVSSQVAPPPIPPPPPPGLPIDGGILFLLVSGIIYGIKKSIKK